MSGSRHVAENAAEAVEEGWRTADDVRGSEEHAGADLVAVIQDGAVSKAGSFGHGGRARGELDVDNVVVGERGRRDRWGDVAVCE